MDTRKARQRSCLYFQQRSGMEEQRRSFMTSAERPKAARTAIRRFQRRARQETDKQALRALILETARREFASGTLESVSIQHIADAVGYSKGTVLKYFPTKLLLLLAVKQQNLEDVAQRLERV